MPGNGRKQAEQMKVQRHNLSLCEYRKDVLGIELAGTQMWDGRHA
jgi:hypothetical protein